MSSKIIKKINYLNLYGEDMTRQERNYLKECKEKQFIESIKGQKIDGKTKAEFRKTEIWKNFRKYMYSKYKTDYLTHRKLKKGSPLHHMRFSPEQYTDLDENFFLLISNASHDLIHQCVSETIKDPSFMERLTYIVNKHIEINNGKDIKDFLKD